MGAAVALNKLLSALIVFLSLSRSLSPWPVNDVKSAEPTNAAAVHCRPNYTPDIELFSKSPLRLSPLTCPECSAVEVSVICEVRICPGNSCCRRGWKMHP